VPLLGSRARHRFVPPSMAHSLEAFDDPPELSVASISRGTGILQEMNMLLSKKQINVTQLATLGQTPTRCWNSPAVSQPQDPQFFADELFFEINFFTLLHGCLLLLLLFLFSFQLVTHTNTCALRVFHCVGVFICVCMS